MRKIAAFVVGLLIAMGSALPALAQATINNLPPVPTFPLPDPGVTPQNLWMTQGGGDYKISPTQLGHIYQGNCATLQTPFKYQLCWNTAGGTGGVLEMWDGAQWAQLVSPSTGVTRVQLASDVTFYVSPTGSDLGANQCINSATPCKTAQYVLTLLQQYYDLRGHKVTIQFADGLYTDHIYLTTRLPGQASDDDLILQGHIDNPSAVLIQASGGYGNAVISVAFGGLIRVENLSIANPAGNGFASAFQSSLKFRNIVFGAVSGTYVQAIDTGVVYQFGSSTIVGSARSHYTARDGGVLWVGFEGSAVITLQGTPTFSSGFARSENMSLLRITANIVSFVGTGGVGARYYVGGNSLINLEGTGSEDFFPGTLPGLSLNGGLYIYPGVSSVSRTQLTSNLTMYVSPTGSDENLCLNPAAPCLTIQRAFDILQNRYDLGGYTATVQLADGTYTSGLRLRGIFLGQKDVTKLVLMGNPANPSAVIINDTVSQSDIFVTDLAFLTIDGIRLTGVNGIMAWRYSSVVFRNMDFGPMTEQHILGSTYSTIEVGGGPHTISGGAKAFFQGRTKSLLDMGIWGGATVVWNITGTPNFSRAFVDLIEGSTAFFRNQSFVGSATGNKCLLHNLSLVTTASTHFPPATPQGPDYLPGSVACSGGVITGGSIYE